MKNPPPEQVDKLQENIANLEKNYLRSQDELSALEAKLRADVDAQLKVVAAQVAAKEGLDALFAKDTNELWWAASGKERSALSLATVGKRDITEEVLLAMKK